MSTEFPFVNPSKELMPIIGQRIVSSRMYKRMGTEEEMASWFETLTGEIGPSVSPGGVRMYCPVSRAAVHKRIKDGRLSCFTFYTERHETGLFGQVKDSREKTPYAYIPVSECKAWRTEFFERKTKNDPKLALELEDAKPDWSGWDVVRAHMPRNELHDLIVELRSLTLGVGSFAHRFDHMQELTGRPAEKVIASRAQEAAQ